MWFPDIVSYSWDVPIMKVTDLSVMCKLENLSQILIFPALHLHKTYPAEAADFIFNF